MARPWDQYITSEIQEVFDRAGYGQRAGMQGRAALLVIDVNMGFLGSEPEATLTSIERYRNSCGPAGWSAMESILRVLSTARESDTPVVFTTGRDDDREIQAATWATKTNRVLEEYDTGIRQWSNSLPETFEVRDNEPTIRKSHASAFFGTRLDIHLRSLGIEQLVICGTATSGCVRASVIDAFSLGYRVALVNEGCFDRSEVSHAINMFDMDQKYADVVDENDAISFLRSGDAR